MKTAAQKLKKLKTRQVYGFKKNLYNVDTNIGDPTTITTLTVTNMVLNAI
jgi:hypothetical protein